MDGVVKYADAPVSVRIEIDYPESFDEKILEDIDMVLVICPGKPLCLLTRGRLWPLETNAQGRAYEAAGVPRRNVTTQQWNDLEDASKHLASRGA